ncbi:histidine phosphatase family protein [Marinobacteraceae bacterium S3BR75-40.1]
MATLHLIRHGQASFGRSNYDQLSERGWQQSRTLGQWLRHTVQPGRVFSGTLQRHQETASGLREGFGDDLPEVLTEERLNEFDHEVVIHRYRPEWEDKSVMARELGKTADPAKAFQKAFADAIRRWVSGDYDADYDEPWHAFRKRVLAGLDSVIEQAAGSKHVLVVTSGGPITIIMQHLLNLGDREALKLNEVLANASVTRVLFSGPRRSLAVFNSYEHLEQASPDLVTFR